MKSYSVTIHFAVVLFSSRSFVSNVLELIVDIVAQD